jgi:hypothetical protein
MWQLAGSLGQLGWPVGVVLELAPGDSMRCPAVAEVDEGAYHVLSNPVQTWPQLKGLLILGDEKAAGIFRPKQE